MDSSGDARQVPQLNGLVGRALGLASGCARPFGTGRDVGVRHYAVQIWDLGMTFAWALASKLESRSEALLPENLLEHTPVPAQVGAVAMIKWMA